MLFDKRILLALDGGLHCADAINRTRLIASNSGCEVELLWFGARPEWHLLETEIGQLESSCRVRRLARIRNLLGSVKQIWQQEHFALLIKGCDLQHDKPSVMAPIDRKLLRETPCPVLLVKRPDSWMGGRILAAINPLSTKEHQLQHDQNVLMLAGNIAREANAELHAIVATPPPMLAAESGLQVQELIDERARSATDQMLKRGDIFPQQIHTGEGPAEFWIAQVAAEQNASLVVISTRARGGIKGALLGNTAEQILDRLDCDVLVLRPGLADQLPKF